MKHVRLSLFMLLLSAILFCFAAASAEDQVEKGVYRRAVAGKLTDFPYFLQLPESFASDTVVLFVMHGIDRNGETYFKTWKKHAEKLNVILVVPVFASDIFATSSAYNRGNIMNDRKQLNQVSDWSFSVIEDLFAQIRKRFGLNKDKYIIFGHSAGAQFVHRMVILQPDLSASLAIAANAGSYTFPDFKQKYHHGLKGLPFGVEQLKIAMNRNLRIMLGNKDTDEKHKHLPRGSKTDRQGKNRLERGRNFLAFSKNVAAANNLNLAWQIAEVENVSHSHKGMAKAAAEVIASHLASRHQ